MGNKVKLIVMQSVDRVVAALYHEEPDMIPLVDSFTTPEARDLFAGDLLGRTADLFVASRQRRSAYGLERKLSLARWWDKDIISIGVNAPTLLSESIACDEREDGYVIARQAYGSITFTRRKPYFHKVLHSPVRWPEDLDRIEPPDLEHYTPQIKAIAKEAEWFKEKGYFVEGFHNGPFVMTWHWLRGLTRFLMDVAGNPSFAKRLVEFGMNPQIELSKAITDEADIDAIRLGNDMGTTRSLFFSPKAYKEIFHPWEKRLVKVYHKKGVFVFHHCHGNINSIFKDMVDAGVDAIDPLDSTVIDLAEVKEKYGDRITLRGGVNKYIGTYDKKQIYEHVSECIRNGAPNGGYILTSAGGLPHLMPKRNVIYYKELRKKLRKYRPD